MKRWLYPLLLGLCVGVACATPPTGGPPNPDRGMELYGAYCIGCHGLNGEGDGPVASRLQAEYGKRPANLSDPSFQAARTDADLARAIARGGHAMAKSRLMPAWGMTLTAAEVQDLVAYVRDLKGGAPQAPMLAVNDRLETGRALYTVHCIACHGLEGHGGPMAERLLARGLADHRPPDLGSARFYFPRSDASLLAHITSPAHQKLMSFSGWESLPLSANDLQAIVFYLRTLPLRDGKP